MNHNHDHEECGHDHGPPIDHRLYPAPNAVTVILVAASTTRRAALSCLKAPWGEPAGEPAIARLVRLLALHPWSRVLTVVDREKQGSEVEEIVAQDSSFVVAPTSSTPTQALLAGLQVALQVTRPPEAVLVWRADHPLTHPRALNALLSSGVEQLSRPGRRWARLLAPHQNPHEIGWPMLLSRATAAYLLEQSPTDTQALSALLRADSVEVLVQRVLVKDAMMRVALDTSVRLTDYSV